MDDSWSSEDPARLPAPPPAADDAGPPVEPTARRADRHGRPRRSSEDARRYPWVGLGCFVLGLAIGGTGLAAIALELDRPGVPEVPAEWWWLVTGGGLVAAWSMPWFLAPRGRRRAAIALAVVTAAVLAVAAVAISGLDG